MKKFQPPVKNLPTQQRFKVRARGKVPNPEVVKVPVCVAGNDEFSFAVLIGVNAAHEAQRRIRLPRCLISMIEARGVNVLVT